MKKLTAFIIFIFLITLNLKSEEKIYISLIINNNPITNIDILQEAKYLTALNSQMQNLPKNEILKIAKDSLLREKIKESELSKHPSLGKDKNYFNNIFNNFYKQLNLNNEEEFANYLSSFNLDINEIKKKIEIEAKWNELIYTKFINKVKVDAEKIKLKLKKQNKTQTTTAYFLSEIFFITDDKNDLKNTYLKIQKSINEIGFKNTAIKFSMSDSAKFGGDLGWLNKNQLSPMVTKYVEKLKKEQVSEIISIPGGFLILKLKDKKIVKVNTADKEKKLSDLILIEKNKKLNQFSLIHFNKVKINSDIINVQ